MTWEANEGETMTLFDELSKPAYAGLSDQEAHAALHTPSIPARQLLPRWRVKQELYLAGVWPVLLAAQAHEDHEIAGLVLTVLAFLNDGDFENIDLDLVAGSLDQLVAVGLLPADLRASIDAMADTLVAPWPSATLLQVIRTRREINHE